MSGSLENDATAFLRHVENHSLSNTASHPKDSIWKIFVLRPFAIGAYGPRDLKPDRPTRECETGQQNVQMTPVRRCQLLRLHSVGGR